MLVVFTVFVIDDQVFSGLTAHSTALTIHRQQEVFATVLSR